MALQYWSAIKLRADGTTINSDACAGVKTGTGLYSVTLDNAMGIPEACPVITPWVVGAAAPGPVSYDATLAADGKVMSIRFFDPAGLPVDSAFCCVISRFSP